MLLFGVAKVSLRDCCESPFQEPQYSDEQATMNVKTPF